MKGVSVFCVMKERYWNPPLELLREKIKKEEDVKSVLNFLHQNLSRDWEFYYKPYLDGLCPDIVLLNENIGIQIIEFEKERTNPLSTLNICKEEILKFYMPAASIKNFRRELITRCLALPFLDKEEVSSKVDEWNNGTTPKQSNYFSIISKETLEEKDIKRAVPFSDWTTSKYMNENLAKSLRAHLITSDYILEDFDQLKIRDLDDYQRNLVLTRTKNGYRAIRGSSGSGKSLVLAAKGLQLIKENKSVILFTYNKTLPNLLRHYYERFKKGDDEYFLLKEKNPNIERENIPVFTHFMRYMKRHFYKKGQADVWKAFFPKGRLVEESMAQMCEVFKNDTKFEEFDAILVDEGQDFMHEWWNACRSILKKDGEAYFVIDNSQDIYKRNNVLSEKKWTGSGLVGRPSVLKASYRLPREYVSHMKKFFIDYIDTEPDFLSSNSEVNMPEISPQLELAGVENCYLSWEQIDEEEGVDRCVKLVLNDLTNLIDKFTYSNITLLTSSVESGRRVVEKLEENNLEVTHTFGVISEEDEVDIPQWDQDDIEDAQKIYFNLSLETIKATTTMSFKGFEAPLIIYFLEKGTSAKQVYTSLTRLRMGHGNTCHIKVVCSNPKFRSYGNTWSPQEGQEWLKI